MTSSCAAGEGSMSETDRAAWAERSKSWARSAQQGRSQDDTFNQMIIRAAGIRPGERVLDTASGTGNPGVSIALALEGQGCVICSDFTPRMLEAARQRAGTLDLSVMDFAACDMTALAFKDNTFDCVTCRFGLMSVEEEKKVTAAREALRVLEPGGRAVYVVWGPYEENPPFHVPCRTVAAHFGEDEGPAPPRHGMSTPGTLEGILSAAGFETAEEHELRYRNEVRDPVEYVERGLKRSFTQKVEGLAEDAFRALRNAVLDAWEPFIEGGVLYVPNYARLGIGWKPK